MITKFYLRSMILLLNIKLNKAFLCFYALPGSPQVKSIKEVADKIFYEIREHITNMNRYLTYNCIWYMTSKGKFFYGLIQVINYSCRKSSCVWM